MLKAKKLHPDAKLPRKAHPSDAGFDLFALENDFLFGNEIEKIKTGLAIAIPPGHVGLILEKSGLAAKHGVQIHGGVIDSNYRGEIIVLMSLHSSNITYDYPIHAGDKIAQLVIIPIHPCNEFTETTDLDDTDRGANGFGSTGVQ